MAKSNSWISHIETFVDFSSSPNQQTASRDAIAALLKSELLTIEVLVKELGLYLTTTDYIIRGRGILLLAELLTCLAAKPLDNSTVHSLVAFFTEKLEDWQVLHGTLIGCLALLRRKRNVGMVTGSDAKSLAGSYLQSIQVQPLSKHDRLADFGARFLLPFSKGYGWRQLAQFEGEARSLEENFGYQGDSVLVEIQGDGLIYGICEAIDGEKDPECLMLTFHIVADLVRLFPDPFGNLAGFVEDLFDVLGRYFPLHFTHPSDDIVVKRDDLSRALMLAFASTPLFEPFVIPLLLDKLSSSLPLAKVDSLKYLSHCSVKYGPDTMAKHANAIWSSLKGAICHSSQESILLRVSESPDDLGFLDDEIAKEALLCMQKFLLQEDGLFLSLILEDEDVELMLRSATSVIRYNDIPVENRKKLYALGCILSASAKVSIGCCIKMFQHFFPRLMDILGLPKKYSSQACISGDSFSTSQQLNFGALYLCIELLFACRVLALSSEKLPSASISVDETWCALLQQISVPLVEVFHFILTSSTTQDVCDADIYCGVKGLQILATYPHCFLPISESTFANILTIFVSILTASPGETLVWKLSLKALMEIGAFIGKFHDSEKASSYMTIVVEKVVSFLCVDYTTMSLPQKLEAFSGIGTAGPNFMLPATQGLEAAISANFSEASVNGNLKSVKTLVPLLQCFSSKMLPWFDKNGGFEDVALRFSVSIWDQIECNYTFNIGDQGKELLDRMIETMKLAVAGCSECNQSLILEKAYNVLSSTCFLLKESMPSSVPMKIEDSLLTQSLNPLSCRDEWVISLFASVIIALRPHTPVQNVRAILKLFISVLGKGHLPVAHALGSVINKLPLNRNIIAVSSACTLEEAMDIVSEMVLCCSTRLRKFSVVDNGDEAPTRILKVGDGDLVEPNAIVGLAWIGKGLVMRGNEKVKDIVMVFLRCLTCSKLGNTLLQGSSEQDVFSLVMRSAADAFHVILSDSDVSLNKRFHATLKPLYKQHFFSTMTPILLTSIKECDSQTTRCFLYRAFGNVISNAPLAAVVNEAKVLIFVLLDGLSILSKSVQDRDLTYSLLLVLSGMIMDESGLEAVTENARSTINRLIGLISYPHMMLVRETAIQCLVAMTGLPHTRIFPMRIQVLQAMSKALDDPKRNVRREAVSCRQAWLDLLVILLSNINDY
ncbi:Mms19 nucleotide excision repair protein-like protein [Thalictrum thalictroides]|uniref:MMS19 nucleotide excision repair protein n=1 Tax=Thalictrum thalictroides TaxID=46969 RepID=A0A7J6XB43_THATH|nr:Mms19 nucleotide excision repair protein-like protein [Thalictrum thalictroides]